MIDYDAFRAEQAAARAEGRLLGIGLGLYVEPSAMAHRAAWPPRAPSSASSVNGQVQALHGQRQPRPEPRDHDRPGRRRRARRRHRRRHRRPGRHRRRRRSARAPAAAAAPSSSAARPTRPPHRVRDKVLADRRPPRSRRRPTTSRSADGRISVRRHAGARRCRSPRSPRLAYLDPAALPPGMEMGLEETGPLHAHGAVHVVERLPRLHLRGRPRHRRASTLLRYVVSEDCGVMINPDVVEGQIAGGVVQGIGGVLLRAHGLRRRRQPARHDVRRLPAADGGRGARSSSTATSRRRRPRTRAATRAWARAAPSARRRRSSTPSPTPSPTSASA